MKRFSYALLLMLLSSTAHARGYSFSIGGHHIHIEAGRHCRSLSCVSWSEGGSRRSRRDDDEAPAPAKPVAPACPPVAAPAAVSGNSPINVPETSGALPASRRWPHASVPQVQVPDVKGKKVDDAKQILQAAGLTVKVQTFIGGNHVQNQSPSAGTTVDKGTPVTLLVFG